MIKGRRRLDGSEDSVVTTKTEKGDNCTVSVKTFIRFQNIRLYIEKEKYIKINLRSRKCQVFY